MTNLELFHTGILWQLSLQGVLMALDVPIDCRLSAAARLNADAYVLQVSGNDRNVMKINVNECIVVSKCVKEKCGIVLNVLLFVCCITSRE